MNMSPTEIEALWSILGKVGAGVVAIAAAIKAIQLIISLLPTSKLEIRVQKCEENLDKDFKHLEHIDMEIMEIKKGQDSYKEELQKAVKGINKIGTSQITLLRHMIDGDGIDDMRKEADDLTKFFIEQ